MRWPPTARLLLVFLAAVCSVDAEEKNGLSVTVSKTTLDRADTRTNYVYGTDRIDRTQGLKVTIKNTSFKPMPEGEVNWTILVRKYLSNSVLKYTGTDKVKGLRPAEADEMVIGNAQILGWKDYNEQYKDKIEYQVLVQHEGKETMRLQSTSNFDILAKRASPAPKNP